MKTAKRFAMLAGLALALMAVLSFTGCNGNDLHPKKVTHKKSTGAKKVTFLEEKNGKRKCTSRSKNQSNN